MRLGKTSLIILGAGIFIMAFIVLYMVYSQQTTIKQDLDEDLASARVALPRVVDESDNWQRQLSQLKGRLTELQGELAHAKSFLSDNQSSFPELVQSIEYDERFFKLADVWRLNIVSIAASEIQPRRSGSLIFSATKFSVQVKGNVADILGYVGALASDQNLATIEVTQVTINIPEPETVTGKEASATIDLVIFGYRGNQNG